jgi:hypothetical protein
MTRNISVMVAAVLLTTSTACATLGALGQREKAERLSVISRSRVWTPTDIPAIDLKAGPQGDGAFSFHETVSCDYVDKKLPGHSPKFDCTIGKSDKVKVKYGGTNGEVYGEVLATRLLWALGFGADRMYPVNVICRGCPEDLGGMLRSRHEYRFDPAVIERKMAGKEWPHDDARGWSWNELDLVNEDTGGAPREQRDAMKLLAVFFQHTDNKPSNQRIVCQDSRSSPSAELCGHPFLMLNDVGLTFGRATRLNGDDKSSVNLEAWRRTPLWKNDRGCVGNLPRSNTGTLDNPVISEEGRRFLADLLMQLSDLQIHQLFEAARVQLRLRSPGDAFSGFATIDEWADAFKQKRSQIADRRCA